jgi:cbb3-type cytochrome oxidase subunit 3
MRKPENNPMGDIIAGILMTCAMITSGYLIFRRKGLTFSRCIGAIIFLLTIFMAVLGFVFDKEYRREYQRYQNSLLKLRSLTPDEATVDNDR